MTFEEKKERIRQELIGQYQLGTQEWNIPASEEAKRITEGRIERIILLFPENP